jgi:hypothetical protein
MILAYDGFLRVLGKPPTPYIKALKRGFDPMKEILQELKERTK